MAEPRESSWGAIKSTLELCAVGDTIKLDFINAQFTLKVEAIIAKPPDIGISVSDEANVGESMGPSEDAEDQD